jgi:hypothetical protein
MFQHPIVFEFLATFTFSDIIALNCHMTFVT